MRDYVEETVSHHQLSSQEAETLQDWLFLSSSQLDHLESVSEGEEGEEEGEGEGVGGQFGGDQNPKEGPRPELGEWHVCANRYACNFHSKSGHSVSRKRVHPEP